MAIKQQLIAYWRPIGLQLDNWWSQRTASEQRVLSLLGAVVALFLLYSLLWQPVMHANEMAQKRYIAAQQTYSWISANAEAINTSRQQATGHQGGGDWAMNVNSSASAAGLKLKGFTPQGDGGVRVTLQQQPFAAVVDWFNTLKEDEAVVPTNVEISATSKPGRVNVHVILSRGS